MKALFIAAIAAFFTSVANAETKIMHTEEGGYLTLLDEPCVVMADSNYKWRSVAYHVGEPEIDGCWERIGFAINVKFPDDPHTYSFTTNLFVERDE
jgi:hypothetical protein